MPDNWDPGSNYIWGAVGVSIQINSEDYEMFAFAHHQESPNPYTILLHVHNIQLDPTQWKYDIIPVPNSGDKQSLQWATAFYFDQPDNMIYIIGTYKSFNSNYVLSRISLSELRAHNLSSIEYWGKFILSPDSQSSWMTWNQVTRLGFILTKLLAADSDCSSLNYHPTLQLYYFPTVISSTIGLAVSSSITGPYTIINNIYAVPKALSKYGNIYCATSHSEFEQSSNEIILSYFTSESSSTLDGKMNSYAYLDRFIRIKFNNSSHFSVSE